MTDSKMKLGNNTFNKNQFDWSVDTITEQIWSDLKGAATRSTIQEVLKEVVLKYEDARIQIFVPTLIRRDAVERLRETRAPITWPGINEADASTESQTSSEPASSSNANDGP